MPRNFFSTFYKDSKRIIQTSTQHNQLRQYKTLNQYTFPKNLGMLIQLTHDKENDETSEEYKTRCFKFIMDLIHTHGQNNLVFFCYSTVFKSNMGKPVDEKSVKKVEQKFLKSENIGSHLIINPGHLALYTNVGNYISHSPKYDQSKLMQISQEEVIRNDVAKSVAENQRVSTYIALLNKACFDPVNFKDITNSIKKYRWDAKGKLGSTDESDNCATAIQKVLLNAKIREYMNPVQTLRFLVETAIDNTNLTEDQKRDILIILEDSGLARNLTQIAQDEEKCEETFDIADESQSSSNSKRSKK